MNVDRSADGGSRFTHVLQIGIGGHYPPSLEVDSAGDVLVVINDAGTTDGAWVYKLPAGKWNSPELMGTLTYGYDDKFTTGYDVAGQSASRGGTYWEMHGGDGPTNNHYVMVVDPSGGRWLGGGPVNTRCTSAANRTATSGSPTRIPGRWRPAGAYSPTTRTSISIAPARVRTRSRGGATWR